MSIEKLGAATTDLLTTGSPATPPQVAGSTCALSSTSPTPQPVDQHDPPERMRELVVLRDSHCVFPGCRRDSRGCDLDHITPYLSMDDGGPPGQTHPGNLAPLCRTHHRIKTHTSWDYKRLDDGQLHVDGTHRTPVRRHPGLPTPTPAKNLTPRHPGPPQPGTQACPGSLLNHRSRDEPSEAEPRRTATTTVEPGDSEPDEGIGEPQRNHRRRRPRQSKTERSPTSPVWFRQAQPTVVTQAISLAACGLDYPLAAGAHCSTTEQRRRTREAEPRLPQPQRSS